MGVGDFERCHLQVLWRLFLVGFDLHFQARGQESPTLAILGSSVTENVFLDYKDLILVCVLLRI